MKKAIIPLCSALLIIATLVGCASSPNTKTALSTADVTRGNLLISVSADGNLVMPQAFDLRFETSGNVEDVFVEEGDFVRAGTVMATLDSSSQQLSLKAANSDVQEKLSELYETIPGIQQTFNFPSFYPNVSASLAAGWFKDEFFEAYDSFLANKYTNAVSGLRLAVADLESCIKIYQDAIENPYSGLGDKKLVESQDMELLRHTILPWGKGYVTEWMKIVDQMKQGQADLENIQTLINDGNYTTAKDGFKNVTASIENLYIRVNDTVNQIKIQQNDTSYPGKDLSLYFYQVAEDKLNEALDSIKQSKMNSVEYTESLLLARHAMNICNSILGNNVLVLQHGLSTKDQQQYNINLATSAVSLDDSRENLLKTMIVAPFDGTVVSVGVKKNDPLSAMDYSSKTAVQLVDTKAIKFEGQVDEIDILKIATGQKATISVDAVPGREFTGRVKFISPYGTADTNNVVKFDLTVELDPSDIELKGGLTATANIEVLNVENVVLVPLSAVSTTPGGSTVTVISGPEGKTEVRPVTLGRQNLQFAEVLSGLEPGEKVQITEKISGAPVITTPPQGPPPGR